MNRQRYRLVFSTSLGALVAVAESARGRGKAASGARRAGAVLATALLALPAFAQKLPTISPGVNLPAFVTYGQAAYQINGNQAFVNQVGNKAILNWQNFNIAPGHGVQFRQVDGLDTGNLVPGASFTTLNRIWDINASVIAGSITQGAGQQGNIILVNTNGIAFMGGSQVNLNSFTASTLNVADKYIVNGLLGDNKNPQYEKSLDGTEARGFIKVFEGARISSDSQGRVMLIAPTVVNRGTIEAPDGQVILAAGSRAFLRSDDSDDLNLRGLLVEVDSPTGLNAFDTANTGVVNGELDGETVNLQLPGDDLLGHATNVGRLSAARGNVTMVGYAVNQSGIARATSSVVANGSVYLMAKDTSVLPPGAGEKRGSTRGGQVTLGAGSLTEVLPETGDATTTVDGDTGTGAAQASQVRALGQQVYMAGGATIKAPSGDVRLTAVDDPSTMNAETGTLLSSVVPSGTARLHLARGAVIDVAGLSGIEVTAARNTVVLELRGDELKDSTVNRTGPLRGEKDLSIDIEQALAHSDAGKDTLIARDSLLAYQARLERGIAERSTAGGTVMLDSQGQTVMENGVTVDLSGGSVAYQQATVKTTVLSANGRRVDMADAVAGTRYDSIVSRYVIDYDRWNEQEVIELPSAQRVVQAYTEGQDAGSLSINSKGATYMQASVVGKTVAGERQLAIGNLPRGAQVRLDARASGAEVSDPTRNQAVVIGREAVNLPAGFGANAELPDDLKQTLSINADLLAKDRAAELSVYTDQAAEVRAALRGPQGGVVDIKASDLTVKADIVVPSGRIDLTVKGLVGGDGTEQASVSVLRVEDGVRLDTSGTWVNLLPAAGGSNGRAPSVDGGSIVLNALSTTDAGTGLYLTQGTVSLGAGVNLDASGGALLDAQGHLKEGAGGHITLGGYAVEGLSGVQLSAYGFSEGGTLDLSTREIGIGGLAPAEASAGSVHLDPALFTQGGFAQYNLTALERLEVADNTTVQPRVTHRELRAGFSQQATGSAMAAITAPVVRNDVQREATSISLAAARKDADTGTLRIGEGARVEVDAGGSIELEARNTLDIEGALVARGGTITAQLVRTSEGGGFLNPAKTANNLWLGEHALLDAHGIAQTTTDTRGLIQGEVLDGGTVTLYSSEALVAEAGSRIDVSGAAPVRIDERNETGGVGRLLASDAGSVNLTFGSNLLLDASFAAAAGSSAQRGGSLDISTVAKTNRIDGQEGFDAVARDVVLQASVAAQTAGLTPADTMVQNGDVMARIGTDPLEAAGFDRLRISNADGIVLADGLNLGAGRSLPLRELQLDAARIDTQGNASLTADAIRLGNYEVSQRVGSAGSAETTGVLTAHARLLDLAGNLRLQGMQRSELTGTELVQLSAQESATIETTGDLTLRGGVITPGSLTQITLKATGRDVRLESVGTAPLAPLSALGSVRIEAQNITQAGRLVAPFGQIELVAQGDLVLAPDSVTSVSAAPGQVLPLGQLQNGVDWLANSETGLETLPDKSIRLTGGAVQLQAGSLVNVSGGGDLQAFEFTVGPGGSSDFLAGANTYAILPGFQGGFAPSDATVGQPVAREGANLADPLQSTGRAVGEAVYLSGVSGLTDGTYTLLPAHYALLPGAMAVRLDSSATLLPGQAYTRQDGVRMAAGYLTDTRTNAPRAGDWRAVEVLTQDQVRDRSEYTLSKASGFFAGTGTLPQDAGLLSLSTQTQIQLDGTQIGLAAEGGRGMALDISAPNLNLVVASGSPEGLDPTATQVDVAKINALGAESVLLGATRTRTGNETALAVGTSQLTLANDAQNPLAAPEVMLAATDTLTLRAGSKIDAQGDAGDAGVYKTEGDGAFVRAASSSATLVRSGTSGATGSLVGEAGSVVQAAKSIAMDATLDNAFAGQNLFVKDGQAVAGQLSLGASRINLGSPTDALAGITFKQSDLNALLGLNTLALTSYAGFDIYGSVDVGGMDANGRPTLQNFTLQGPGLAGVVNGDADASATVNVRAVNLTLTNSGATEFNPAGTLGSGQLNVLADKLMLGTGEQKSESGSAPGKTIAGFSNVHIEAGEIIAAGTGSTEVQGVTTLATARMAGVNGAMQTLSAGSELLTVKQIAPAQPLAASTSLGAGWTLNAGAILFDTEADLASGQLALNASTGDITLGADADLNVAGRNVAFYNVTRGTWGGTVALKSDNGSIHADAGSRIDVSGGVGADGGTLVANAVNGSLNLENAALMGTAKADADGQRGEGARVRLDAGSLGNFSTLSAALNAGDPAQTLNFSGERTVRVRTSDLNIAAGDTVLAKDITLSADTGAVNVAGTVSASGAEGGKVGLYGQSVVLASGGRVEATASAAGSDGGKVEIGASTGTIDLQTGSIIDVSAEAGGEGGTLHLRALRNGNDVAVTALAGHIDARDVSLEAVRVYNNIATLNATGASSGTTLSLATINTNDNAYAANHANIKRRLGTTGDTSFHVVSGTEVRSSGNMALGDGTAAKDWNLKDSAAGGEAGVLTLRAGGNLDIKSNLSDGFTLATATPVGSTAPTTLLANTVRGGRSWSFNLVAGADTASANVMATEGTGDLTVAAGRLVRTGTGDIRMAAGQDIKLASSTAAVYTAGRLSETLPNFTAPRATQAAYFTQGGGDIEMTAGRNVESLASTQLYSEWLFRQGRLSGDGVTYEEGLDNSLAWWVRFDKFAQGVAALGGGDVTVRAGQTVKNLSVSTPTQGRMASATADASRLVKTGGGAVTVEAGADVLAGKYFADNGDVRIVAGGQVSSSPTAASVYTVLAVGDGQVSVQATGDVQVAKVLNPQLLDQLSGSGGINSLVNNTPIKNNTGDTVRRSYFSTYAAESGASLSSLGGSTALLGSDAVMPLPPSLSMTAFSGDVTVESNPVLTPSAQGQLALLAQNNVNLNGTLTLSDNDPTTAASVLRPVYEPAQALSPDASILHAPMPVHLGDTSTVKVYAVQGDVTGQAGTISLNSAKAVEVRAGRDVDNVNLRVQNTNPQDRSVIEAGRDVIYDAGAIRQDADGVYVGGPGVLEVSAQRDVNLGTSGGLLSRGDLDNGALGAEGVDIRVMAGVGPAGLDAQGALQRLAARVVSGTASDTDLWLVRWLSGNHSLSAAEAPAAVAAVAALDLTTQNDKVRDLVFNALRQTGRDANAATSGYAGDFARGYAVLELVFPGIAEQDANGHFANYEGSVNLFASRIRTERGGNIDILVPGGGVVVGLANTSATLTNTDVPGSPGALGVVVAATGDVRGFARDDMLVNQSRILTVAGGDVLLWSSEGDIDAGKGKKTASSVPPPLIKVDPSTGKVTQELQGAASGSGIGALKTGDVEAGDVDLIAPKGTVNAGDAGIRAGNLNIAALVVLGADNITVTGTSSGTPVADTSAVTAASSGATAGGDDTGKVVEALNAAAADSAKAAQELAAALKPSVVRVEVLGYGE